MTDDITTTLSERNTTRSQRKTCEMEMCIFLKHKNMIISITEDSIHHEPGTLHFSECFYRGIPFLGGEAAHFC